MARAKVELPNGKIATVEIPDGMSMEEASAELQSMYDADPASFGARPANEENNEGDVIGGYTPPESSMGDDVFNYLSGEMNQKTEGAPQGLQDLVAGIRRSSLGMTQGARKLYNQAIGDDETVSRIEAQNQQMKDDWQQRDPSGSGLSMGDVGKLLGDVGTFGAASAAPGMGGLLAGTGLGAAEGILQPTTQNESQMDNALLGAGGAAAGQLAGMGAGKLVDMLRRVDAPEALESLTRTMGAERGGVVGPQYEAITDAVENQRDELAKALSARYQNIENAATIPVNVQNASRLGEGALSLPEEVINSLNPGAARTMNALTRGATRTSPILDQSGAPIQQARDVSFTDVRETIRELRRAKRAMPYTDAGMARARQIDNIIERLDDDLTQWAGAGPEVGPGNADILRGAREVDSDWAQQVAPFDSRDAVLGQLRRGMADEGAVNRLFLGDNKGQAVEELISRVPEARDPVRALYASKLLQEAGDISSIRKLEGGTTAEQLLSPAEREYATALAANVRDNKAGSALDVGRILRSLLRAPVAESLGGAKVDKMLSGILPYGAQEADTTVLQQLLRAYGASQSQE